MHSDSTAPPVFRDAGARRRIVSEFYRSLLVEAGAGSGKTHEMARRMAAGVAAGVYRVEQMAAVTFTRKAAAELRGRFQIALEQELRQTDAGRVEDPGDTSDADLRCDRILAALSGIERFFAGTIHAFCARLLRERPVEAGVSPGFTELDDAEDAMLREQSWRDYRSQAKANGDPAYLALLDTGVQAKQLNKAFETICLYEDVEFPAGAASPPDDGPAWLALEAFWAALSAEVPPVIDPGTTCEMQGKILAFRRDWRLAQRTRRTPAALARLLESWDFKPKKIIQYQWSDDRREQKRLAALIPALHEQFRTDTVQPFLTAWRQHVYALAVPVLVAARQIAAEERRRRSLLSFNDLLLRTAQLLRRNADVRHAMQRKYRWLFVDEFQDTDPIQAEIMFLLAADEQASGSAGPAGPGPAGPGPAGPHAPGPAGPDGPDGPVEPLHMSLRPGALFVVGDPKQSIYRFRRADIDIYNQVRARLSGPDGQGVVTLTSNFRSVPMLCDWANTVFDGQFPAHGDVYTPAFARLDAVRGAEAAQGLFKLLIPDNGEDGVDEEASLIARYIRTEVDAGRRTFGDFLVLTRRKKTLQRYAEALEALQVPVEVSGAGGFARSVEVQQLALLLLALTDPQDAVALVGVLRGPLFGVSDRDLFAWRAAGGWFGIFGHAESASLDAGATPANAATGHVEAGSLALATQMNGRSSDPARSSRVASALETLRRWYKWSRVLPAGAALDRILDDSGYLALAAASPDGAEAGDLLHAVDRVRAVVESGFTLAEAAEALASWSELDEDGPKESNEIESLPLRPGRTDVVRVMNLHKAKGLEATVVFLADPLGGIEQTADKVDVRIVRPTAADMAPLGFCRIVEERRNGSKKLLAAPAGWNDLCEEEQRYLEAEQTRLLYVAATRARDVLIVGYRARKGRGTPAWSALDAHLHHAPALSVPEHVGLPAWQALDLSVPAADRAMRAAETANARVARPSWAAASVTAEIKRLPRMTGAGTGEADEDDPTRAITADTPSRRADAGVAWGTLVHGLLEHAMRHPAATRDDLRRLAMWLTVEEPQLRDVIDRALDTVTEVARAAFWAEARAAGEVHEEAPFAVREVAADGLPKVLTGVIDLVHRTPDGWKVVDYKTDRDSDSADLSARYGDQVAAYERAWARVSGTPVTSSVVGARPAEAPPPASGQSGARRADAAASAHAGKPPAGQPRLFE